MFQLLVWTSRVFVGTHFPHQCLFGTFLGSDEIHIFSLTIFSCSGYIIITTVYKRKFWMKMSRPTLLIILTFMFLSITTIHFISLILEADPTWAITRAIQWCYGTMMMIFIVFKRITRFVLRPVLDLHHKQLLGPDDDLHWVGAGAGHRPHQPPEPDIRWAGHLARPGGGAPPLHSRVSVHLGHSKLSAAVTFQTL